MEHKKITPAQLEIWLDSQVTKVYFQCLQWSAEQISEVLGKGGFVGTTNDATCNRIHQALGEKEGLLSATAPTAHLSVHQMIEIPKEEA